MIFMIVKLREQSPTDITLGGVLVLWSNSSKWIENDTTEEERRGSDVPMQDTTLKDTPEDKRDRYMEFCFTHQHELW